MSSQSSPEPVVRRFRPADRDAVIALLEDSYRTTWAPNVSEEAWNRWSAQEQPRHYVEAMGEEFVVAEVSGEVAGMIHWRGDFIHALHVHSRFRRRRIGTILMAHAEEAIANSGHQSVRLETDSFNAASRGFYGSHGFAEAGERPDEEWDSGLSTLLLVKPLGA